MLAVLQVLPAFAVYIILPTIAVCCRVVARFGAVRCGVVWCGVGARKPRKPHASAEYRTGAAAVVIPV